MNNISCRSFFLACPRLTFILLISCVHVGRGDGGNDLPCACSEEVISGPIEPEKKQTTTTKTKEKKRKLRGEDRNGAASKAKKGKMERRSKRVSQEGENSRGADIHFILLVEKGNSNTTERKENTGQWSWSKHPKARRTHTNQEHIWERGQKTRFKEKGEYEAREESLQNDTRRHSLFLPTPGHCKHRLSPSLSLSLPSVLPRLTLSSWFLCVACLSAHTSKTTPAEAVAASSCPRPWVRATKAEKIREPEKGDEAEEEEEDIVEEGADDDGGRAAETGGCWCACACSACCCWCAEEEGEVAVEGNNTGPCWRDSSIRSSWSKSIRQGSCSKAWARQWELDQQQRHEQKENGRKVKWKEERSSELQHQRVDPTEWSDEVERWEQQLGIAQFDRSDRKAHPIDGSKNRWKKITICVHSETNSGKWRVEHGLSRFEQRFEYRNPN